MRSVGSSQSSWGPEGGNNVCSASRMFFLLHLLLVRDSRIWGEEWHSEAGCSCVRKYLRSNDVPRLQQGLSPDTACLRLCLWVLPSLMSSPTPAPS